MILIFITMTINQTYFWTSWLIFFHSLPSAYELLSLKLLLLLTLVILFEDIQSPDLLHPFWSRQKLYDKDICQEFFDFEGLLPLISRHHCQVNQEAFLLSSHVLGLLSSSLSGHSHVWEIRVSDYIISAFMYNFDSSCGRECSSSRLIFFTHKLHDLFFQHWSKKLWLQKSLKLLVYSLLVYTSLQSVFSSLLLEFFIQVPCWMHFCLH